MQYWRCQCGKKELFESGMRPQDCQGCDECGTTLSQSPGGHKPREPHQLVLRYSTKTGKPEKQMCKVCHRMFPLDYKQE